MEEEPVDPSDLPEGLVGSDQTPFSFDLNGIMATPYILAVQLRLDLKMSPLSFASHFDVNFCEAPSSVQGSTMDCFSTFSLLLASMLAEIPIALAHCSVIFHCKLLSTAECAILIQPRSAFLKIAQLLKSMPETAQSISI